MHLKLEEKGEPVPESSKSSDEVESWLDRKLKWLGEHLVHAEGRRVLRGCFVKGLRRILTWLTFAYFGGTLVFLLALGWVGERNLATAFLLYVPPLTWLLPAVPLALAALLLSRKLILLHMLWVAFYCLWYMDFGFIRGGEAAGVEDFELTVMSFNSGQRAGSLRPFKNLWKPDVLATQEGSVAVRYLGSPGYEEFTHGKSEGEFMLLSKYPIVDSGVISATYADVYKGRPYKMAAWFELDLGDGKEMVVYNVHLPSPRDTLKANLRGGLLYGILGIPGTGWADVRRQREIFWSWRVYLAEQLVGRLEKETRPYLVVGDFNAPAHGHIYGMVSGVLRDAHAVAGQGYGFTFPGVTRNPLALFGPWMRIDYLFADKSWKVLWCETEEKGRPSQHLALVARFARGKDSF